MATRRVVQVVAALAATVGLVAGCGSDPSASPPPGSEVPAAGRGWLGGEPDWSGGGSADGGARSDAMEGAASGGDVASPTTGAPSSGPPRAGSIDDNTDLDGYLAYLDRLRNAGVQLRDLDPTGRILVTVTGSNDRPVAGAEVVVEQGGRSVATIRTTADGTARVLPRTWGATGADPVTLTVEGATATAAPGDAVTIALDRPGGRAGPAPVDVLFLLDATGSMSDEIDQLKASIDSVSSRIDALSSQPDVRFAMTLYRDEGDAFVTASYDFTDDVEAFRAALADVVADGGGDYPEALEEGLAEALAKPAWRDPATTTQLVFLVADAPPQIARDLDRTYVRSIQDAVGRGVKVFPVASSESDDQAEGVFRQIAQATGARFVFLSYGAAGAATGDHTDIATTDYEELSLDDLVVRLVSEELDHLAVEDPPPGTTTTTGPPETTTTTRPNGQ